MASLHLVDYVIISLMLVFSASVGIYYHFTGGKQKTTKEYLLADGQMSVWPVAMSLMASFTSAITLLGVPAEIYMYGTSWTLADVGYFLATPICMFVFLPVFYELKLTSVYDYLERRFDKKVRVAASLTFMVHMILYMPIVLYAPALALSAVTGISKWVSIISVGLVCTFYSSLGGIKAVLWTDVYQTILMLAAMYTVIIKGLIDVGGFGEVWERSESGARIDFFNIDPNPTTRHSVWGVIICGAFLQLSLYGVNQVQVQRLLTVKNLRESQMALFLSWPFTSLVSLTSAFAGLVLFAYFWKCDPLLDEKITQMDQILPYFVMHSLNDYPGLPGLVISGVFSGALSSVSSIVNSLAAVTLNDYINPLFLKNSSKVDTVGAIVSKILALFYGLLCILLTVVVENLPGIFQAANTAHSVVGGPLLMLFTAGMCTRFCHATGTFIGFIVCLMYAFWLGFGALFSGPEAQKLNRFTESCDSNNLTSTTTMIPDVGEDDYFFLYKVSYVWYAASSWALGLIVSISISLIFRQKNDFHESLLTPWMRRKNYKHNNEEK